MTNDKKPWMTGYTTGGKTVSPPVGGSVSSAELLDAFMLDDLRKLLRTHFPQARGAFARCITKKDCADVLAGDVPIAEMMLRCATATPLSPEPEPASGSEVEADGDTESTERTEETEELASGEHAIDEGKAEASEDDQVLGVIDVLTKLRPDVGDKLRDLYIHSQRTPGLLAPPTPIISDTQVEVPADDGGDKLMLPRLPEDGWLANYIPNGTPGYNLWAWRAVANLGGVVVEVGVRELVRLILDNFRVLLVGPPGVGKTSIVQELAALMRWPMSRFNASRDVTVDDFVGCWQVVNGGTEFLYGPLPTAMRDGHILVIDEVDHMPAECSSILHAPLEPNGKLCITANGGEVIAAHDRMRWVATPNTTGFGDETGVHPNAQVQDAAKLDRWDVALEVTWMGWEDEARLLARYGVPENCARAMVNVATDTRSAAARAECRYPITTRQTMAWARALAATAHVGLAFSMAVVAKKPTEERAMMQEIAQRHFGRALVNGDIKELPKNVAKTSE